MVSAAGPLTNMALAVVAALLLRAWGAWGPAGGDFATTVRTLLTWTVIANLGLCFFNMIPLFPLDGHHILRELLPAHTREGFMRWQLRFGSFLLMAMIFGPRLVEIVTRRPVPYDPISLYMIRVIRPMLRLLT